MYPVYIVAQVCGVVSVPIIIIVIVIMVIIVIIVIIYNIIINAAVCDYRVSLYGD